MADPLLLAARVVIEGKSKEKDDGMGQFICVT